MSVFATSRMSNPLLSAQRSDTAERVIIEVTSYDELRSLSDARLLICPHCNSLVVLKAGRVRQSHFAHFSLIDCTYADHEPETAVHRAGKLKLFRHFSVIHPEATGTVEQSIPATGQRADTFFQFESGLAYALEFQQAENSVIKWRDRRQKYRSAGVRDVWFLASNRFQTSRSIPFQTAARLGAIPVPREDFGAQDGAILVHELEKAVADADGILYFLDPDAEQDDLMILLPQHLQGNTLRAFRYVVSLSACHLENGKLWTPLTPLLDDYRAYRRELPLKMLPD